MFAVIRAAMSVPGTSLCHGQIVSRHRSAKTAIAAVKKAQARCRKANGANTWLDIDPIEVTQDSGSTAHGRRIAH